MHLKGRLLRNYLAFFLTAVLFSCSSQDTEPDTSMVSQTSNTGNNEAVPDENHLKDELSPYLLQHADNPVHWYPWGAAAFAKARNQNKPIFLSIGYSTCHWCHVMEHESFENREIAGILNQHFVAVKVDREERPDIDNIYMKVVMSLTGSGGWPLTVFLTPEQKPFYGGTYFPPESQWGRPGFKELLQFIKKGWEQDKAEIVKSSDDITRALKEDFKSGADGKFPLEIDIFHSAYKNFKDNFDMTYGGFGTVPKFPSAHNLSFLLRYWKRTGEQAALEIVKKTLSAMAAGGLYDHVGGGFHRYSTDRTWHIPHFEKMLYDQAALSKIYLEAYQATGNEAYAQVARAIFEYVLRDMTDRNGGFYSAEDADSAPPGSDPAPDLGPSPLKKEGAFYVWRKQEIDALLGQDHAEIFSYYYGVKNDGNAGNDPHGEFRGTNILYISHTMDDAAKHFNRSPAEIEKILQAAKEQLFSVRSGRPRPHLDDKILADWNGLMISSFAFGSRVLNDPRYRDAAEKAAQFILKNLVREDGRLLHRFRNDDAAVLGTLDDYAFFEQGLLDLYEATFKAEYLYESRRLAEDMTRLFEDAESGGFFFVGKDAEPLLFKDKEIYDGAIPSGNSVAALTLLRIGRYTLNHEWGKHGERLLDAFSHELLSAPNLYAQTLIAVDFLLGPSKEIILAEGEDKPKVRQILEVVYGSFIPNKIVIYRPFDDEQAMSIIRICPFVEKQIARENQTTVYVCENYVCKFPASEITQIEKLLK